MEDADGNWVIPIGQDFNALDLLLDDDMNIRPPTPPPSPPRPSSLIPNRLAAVRARQSRIQIEARDADNEEDSDSE